MEREKTLKEVKFEKSWACSMLAEIRDALEKGHTLRANTMWDRLGDESFSLLDVINATLDNVGAKAAIAEQDAVWAIERAKARASK